MKTFSFTMSHHETLKPSNCLVITAHSQDIQHCIDITSIGNVALNIL